MFALNAQRLTARSKHLNSRCAGQDPDCQGSRRIDDMLAIVKHEQHLLIPKTGNQAG